MGQRVTALLENFDRLCAKGTATARPGEGPGTGWPCVRATQVCAPEPSHGLEMQLEAPAFGHGWE